MSSLNVFVGINGMWAFSLAGLCIVRLEHDFNGLKEALDPNRAQCARDQMIQNDCELR